MLLQKGLSCLISAAAASAVLLLRASVVNGDFLNNDASCPNAWSTNADVMCTADVSPVVCLDDGQTCEYSNGCVASTAEGINSDSCCLKCPNPTWSMDDPVCDDADENDEVVCQRTCMDGVMVDCVYSSLCNALAAGLEEGQCYTPGEEQNDLSLTSNSANDGDKSGEDTDGDNNGGSGTSSDKILGPFSLLQLVMVAYALYFVA
mmetsp:Transcript_46849/g.69668  ORF Transcript_46849/g.69668 Transcript_46849/m.69668 type:complete len:205 (-) Transcript_46849:170-784(-)|eukprot:CAMPEP_0194043874 /NCGR_PEP_ID=MMETSP0009_2-20130614/15438_1 /TAXON_ID=210454 /ORGANISM="Grammatophora oceanica, Strain CCMP 410" /LENGTH=204 /DNA_ID=CAMNT_0038688239 /DNA_START=68 /DNA_END=682 /DNA_ORIENTATION=+